MVTMTDTTTFAELLAAANEKTGRGPGQWTPAACRVWREAEANACYESTGRSQISHKLTRVSYRDEQTPCPLL
jgi:hypothetical protein